VSKLASQKKTEKNGNESIMVTTCFLKGRFQVYVAFLENGHL